MPATKTPAQLSITKATAQARRIVARVMPNIASTVTVKSDLSHNLRADLPIVVTVITFPAETPNHQRRNLADGLYELSGYWGCEFDTTRVKVTRRISND